MPVGPMPAWYIGNILIMLRYYVGGGLEDRVSEPENDGVF